MNPSLRRLAVMAVGVQLVALATGCVSKAPVNPTLPLDSAKGKQQLLRMAGEPQPLARPLLVLGGWLDPGFVVDRMARVFKKVTADERIVKVSFAFCSNFEKCREHVLKQVDKDLGPQFATGELPVDVVGFSMGGLVARHAAIESSGPEPDARRLNIVRLFTIATPHRGARMAKLPTLNSHQIDMRHDSAFLARLDEALPTSGYDIFPYVRLGDKMVGAVNAAPPGRTAWWAPSPPLGRPHLDAAMEPAITADIAARLRGEKPFSIEPPAPLPADEEDAAEVLER